jgi:uncharacterized membrane protein
MTDFLILMHPRLVHFPIALFVTALGLDVFGLVLRKENLHKMALYIYVIATFTTPIIVQTGILEQTRLHLNHPVLSQHRLLGLWAMWFSLTSLFIIWLVKRFASQYFRIIFFLALIFMAIVVSATAHYGGRMVYEYGVGIQN